MKAKKGDPQVEDGHVDIANEIAEALARTQLSGYESRYLWVLWRKTYGWHKKEDVISNSQFVEATGLKKWHISRTEKRLIQRKIVAKIGNKLSFNKHYKDWEVAENGNSEKLPKLPKSATELPKKATIVAENGGHKRKKKLYKRKHTCEVAKIGNLHVSHIFNFWKKQMNHPKAILTADRKAKILARLKDYSPHDCLLAILGCRHTRWNMGENPGGKKYNQIDLIFRNGEKMETFRDTGETVRREQKQNRPLRPVEIKRQREEEAARKKAEWQKQLNKWEASSLEKLQKEVAMMRGFSKKIPVPEDLLRIIQEKEFQGVKNEQ